MFVFTQPLISTLCLHYFVFSHFFHSASCSSSSPGECTALFQNLKHSLYVWSRRLMKMKKKGAQPSVQMSIKIKKGKQFCQWFMLLLLFFCLMKQNYVILEVYLCVPVGVLERNKYEHARLHTYLQENRTSREICGSRHHRKLFENGVQVIGI